MKKLCTSVMLAAIGLSTCRAETIFLDNHPGVVNGSTTYDPKIRTYGNGLDDGYKAYSGIGQAWADNVPEVPRIDSVVTVQPQSHKTDQAIIWYDDFDGKEKRYSESQGGLDAKEAYGGQGCSMLCYYEKGTRGVGNRKVFFGDSPVGKVVNKGKHYDDIYWRIYVKHQYGWTGGGPAKLSRATSIVSPNWTQAMIAHVWSSGEALTLDPATGVRGNKVVTRKYNDFGNLRWLGNKPTSRFKLHSAEESGRWVCVEARAKLNTPGKKEGLNQLWIDGRLETERTNLDWRGSYTKHGINAVFLETYWNRGSPVTQSRWIDNFVIVRTALAGFFARLQMFFSQVWRPRGTFLPGRSTRRDLTMCGTIHRRFRYACFVFGMNLLK